MVLRGRILSQCALVSDNKAGRVKILSIIDRKTDLTCVHLYKYYVFTRVRTLIYITTARRNKLCSKMRINEYYFHCRQNSSAECVGCQRQTAIFMVSLCLEIIAIKLIFAEMVLH
jgi:hypothetical protein